MSGTEAPKTGRFAIPLDRLDQPRPPAVDLPERDEVITDVVIATLERSNFPGSGEEGSKCRKAPVVREADGGGYRPDDYGEHPADVPI